MRLSCRLVTIRGSNKGDLGTMKSIRSAAVAALLAAAGIAAQAGEFACISGSLTDCTAATSALSWTWDGLDFTIANDGLGYVSEVYFDLLGGMSVSFQGGTGGNVFFYSGANPGSLPGGNSVGFVSDKGFDSDPAGTTRNGIDSGEAATFRIVGATADSFTQGALAAGVHVRSLVNDSASLVTTTVTTPVPEPETYAMMLLGFGAVAWAARGKKKA
jgi:PEP-CTERM motif